MSEIGRRPGGAGTGTLPGSRRLRVTMQRRTRQREGSLAAALTQSMALAVMGTAGAYPSWVLVSGRDLQIVLGATWVINTSGPSSGSLLLGRNGAPLMMAIAFCCIFSVFIGSLALTLDFLGWRRWRAWAPLFHGFTTLLIVCAIALGFALLKVISTRIRTRKEFQVYDLSASPGQSLFLAFLAGILAAAATYISFKNPAQAELPHGVRDLALRFFPSRIGREAFTATSAVTSLRNAFGLGSRSMEDGATGREELYECEKCRKLHTSFPPHECPVEKRRRHQEAKEEPGRGAKAAVKGGK